MFLYLVLLEFCHDSTFIKTGCTMDKVGSQVGGHNTEPKTWGTNVMGLKGMVFYLSKAVTGSILWATDNCIRDLHPFFIPPLHFYSPNKNALMTNHVHSVPANGSKFNRDVYPRI